MDATGETVLYQDGQVVVTNRRVRLGERSYALSDVRSVALIRPILKRSYGWIALIVGIILMIVGYVVWNGVLLSPMVGGVALILAGVVLLVAVRERYIVRFNEPSGGVVELPLADGTQADRVVSALSQSTQPSPRERAVGG